MEQLKKPESLTENMRIRRRQEVVEEVKRQLWLAVPLSSVGYLQYSLQTISVIFVGHIGTLPLSGTSMATSFAAVTGFILLVGSPACAFSIIFSLHQTTLYTFIKQRKVASIMSSLFFFFMSNGRMVCGVG